MTPGARTPASLDDANPLNAIVTVRAPALSHREWLQTLNVDSPTRVLKHNGELMPTALITGKTPCFLWIGKLKFHRSSGWQVERNAGRCYRMKLRLVRNEKDCQ